MPPSSVRVVVSSESQPLVDQLWLLLPALADLSLQGKGMEEAVAFRPGDSDNICEPEPPPVAAAVLGVPSSALHQEQLPQRFLVPRSQKPR